MKIRYFSRKAFPLFLLIFTIFNITSCITVKEERWMYGRFKFKQKPDEINLTSNFVLFLKSHPACSIVLRVPIKQNNIVEEDNYMNRTIYFAIEQKLISKNFIVVDRSIFERKFAKDSAYKSSADLIIELVDFRKVNYYTNKVIPEESKDDIETTFPKFFYFTGATASFKITNIHTSEIVATFILNYTPCVSGCKMRYTSSGRVENLSGDLKSRKKMGYESTDIDENYEMFVDLAGRLANKLREESYENK